MFVDMTIYAGDFFEGSRKIFSKKYQINKYDFYAPKLNFKEVLNCIFKEAIKYNSPIILRHKNSTGRVIDINLGIDKGINIPTNKRKIKKKIKYFNAILNSAFISDDRDKVSGESYTPSKPDLSKYNPAPWDNYKKLYEEVSEKSAEYVKSKGRNSIPTEIKTAKQLM